jgi:hypothetical protein
MNDNKSSKQRLEDIIEDFREDLGKPVIHCDPSAIKALLAEIERLRKDMARLLATSKTGGSDTCITCAAHVLVITEDLEPEIERLRAALERIAHAKSSVLNAEQFARAESMLQRWAADALNKAPPDETTALLPADQKLKEFFSKHALGPLARPSCIVCGHVPKDWPPAIQHMELPGIVVCFPCRDAAQAARIAVTSDGL